MTAAVITPPAPERSGIPASAIAVAAFFALLALPRPAIPLIDGDVYWHIRAGLEVLASGRVPNQDTWSIVGSGMAWTSQDWLSNVILAAAWRIGEFGPTLASFIWALLVVLALAFLWWAVRLRRPDAGWLGRIVWLAAGLVVAGATLGTRVQAIDLTMAGATLLVLWGYLATRRRRWLIGLPVITLLWVNLHAGWPILFLLGGALLVGEAADRLLRRSLDTEPLTWNELAWLAGTLAVCIPLVAINPNGLALYVYPIQTSSIAAHRDFVSEWQPPDPGTFIGQAFIVFTLVFVLPVFLAWRRVRLADALLMAGLTAMTFTAARFLIVAPLTAAVAVLYGEPLLADTRLSRTFGPILRRLGTPRRNLSGLNAVLVGLVVVIGLVVTWARINPDAQRDMVDDHMPVAAVQWINANDPGDRPFNQYSWGGYLGLMRPEHPVFIDGRSDIYGDAPIRRYAETVRLERDPQQVFDEDGIEYVLFEVNTPLAQWLDRSDGWRRAYADDLAGVWVRS
ncbi:MAG TPA: hypothetical protein VFK61_06435 [Candidatus Limnocylindria bacterium]|nr:hypothetical protein [Candidatus Limnocylindria bacterium]